MTNECVGPLESFDVLEAQPRVLYFLPGNAGNNIAREIVDKESPCAHQEALFCVVNTEGALMRALFNPTNEKDQNLRRWIDGQNSQLQLLQLNLASENLLVSGNNRRKLAKGHGSGGDHEIVKLAFEREKGRIDEIFRGMNFVVNVGAGGGGTGSACLVKAAEKCLELEIPFLTMLITPFLSEGEKVALADEVRRRLLELGPLVVLHNDLLPDKNIRFRDAWTQINQAGPLKLLSRLRTVTQEVGNIINGDLGDIVTALEGGNEVYLGDWEMSLTSPGEPSFIFSSEKVVQALCNHPFQNNGILKYGRRIFTWFEGPWMVNQAQEIQRGIEAQMGLPSGGRLYIKWAIRDVPEDEKMWALLIVSGSREKIEVLAEEDPATEPIIQAPDIIGEQEPTTAASDSTAAKEDGFDGSINVSHFSEYPTTILGGLGKIVGTYNNGLSVEIWPKAELARKWNAAFHKDLPDLELLQELRLRIREEDRHKRLLDLPTSAFSRRATDLTTH